MNRFVAIGWWLLDGKHHRMYIQLEHVRGEQCLICRADLDCY